MCCKTFFILSLVLPHYKKLELLKVQLVGKFLSKIAKKNQDFAHLGAKRPSQITLSVPPSVFEAFVLQFFIQ